MFSVNGKPYIKFHLKQIIALFAPRPAELRERFLTRFAGRTLIVHEGLSIGWVSELLKEAGGAGHFRFDIRQSPDTKPTPIEWVVHQHVAPLHLPLPLLIKVEQTQLFIRHLTRKGKPVHPSEIFWMLKEFPEKAHGVLHVSGESFIAEAGMPISENVIDYDPG